MNAHTHIIGQTGTGKSTLLVRSILNEIEAGHGLMYIDPHGYDTDTILEHFLKRRADDLILFNVSDYDFPIGFNPLQSVPPERRPFVASAMLDMFKSVWGYTHITTPQFDQYVYNSIASLLDTPGASLLGMKYLLDAESSYRKRVIGHITDPIVKDFWDTEFAALTKKEKREETRSTRNKIGILLSDPRIRNTIGQSKSRFDLYDVLKGKVLLVRLPQGKLGLQKTRIVGSLMLSAVQSTALSRSDANPFHIFIDECHHFDSPALIEMLSGIRKFGVSITCAHQYMRQLSPELHAALIGNCGTTIAFRTGIDDARALQSVFPPDNNFPTADQLEPHKALVTREAGKYEEVRMPPLSGKQNPKMRERLIKRSRFLYARKRGEVAAELAGFMADS